MDNRIVSPKIEIINHFDNLMHRVDIDIEEYLEKYNEEQVLGDLKCFKSIIKKEETKINVSESIGLYELSMDKSYEIEQPGLKEEEKINELLTNKNSEELEYSKMIKTVDLWSEETKVVDYLNQIRTRTIEELRKAQEEALEIYKSQSDDLNKFYFQVYMYFSQSKRQQWIFNLFTFVTDFYMSPEDITLLENLINFIGVDRELYSNVIFDEKMILIGLLRKHFFENLKFEKFPSHLITVRKRDLLNIKQIYFYNKMSEFNLTGSSIYLSNLECLYTSKIKGRFNLDGISSLVSLRLELYSFEYLSIRNLPSLKHLELSLYSNYRIDSMIESNLLDYLPSIQYLTLDGILSDFNLDSLVNLKSLSLLGMWDKEFNFDLFKNICYQLEKILILINYIDDKCISKLFYGYHFPNLNHLSISYSYKISKLEKKFFDRFPMLQSLSIISSMNLREIDSDAFSNLKQLISLDLSINNIASLDKKHFFGLDKLKYLNLRGNQLESIEENLFLNLKNLKILDLSHNNLKELSANSFTGLGNLKCLVLAFNYLTNFDLSNLNTIGNLELIDLTKNEIDNREEILNRFMESNIKFVF